NFTEDIFKIRDGIIVDLLIDLVVALIVALRISNNLLRYRRAYVSGE
ncbi:MAG: hypothetical protein ACI89Z_001575, partial [Porticoccus sp.]